jgi:hypothetical protein
MAHLATFLRWQTIVPGGLAVGSVSGPEEQENRKESAGFQITDYPSATVDELRIS